MSLRFPSARKNWILRLEVGESSHLERLFVDLYYGIPLQWEEYIVEGDDEVLQTKYSFARLAAGNIKSAEVLPPS